MSSEGLFGQAVYGARWLGLTRGVSQLLMWVATIFVVRLLAPKDYGIMAMAGVLTTLANLLLDGGLDWALVQRKEVPLAVYRSANSALILIGGLVTGIVQLVAWPLAQFFSEPMLEPVLRVASLQFPINALAVVPSSILMKKMRFKELGIASSIASVSGGVGNLVFAWKGFGVWALVLGVLVYSVMRLVLMSIYAGRPVGFSLRFSLLRSYVHFSTNLIAQRFVWFYVEQIDHLIVGRTLGASPLGTYSVSRNLSHMPLDRTASIVNQIALPSFAAVQDDKERWHLGLQKLVRLASTVSYPMFFGMAAVAPLALPLILGERWEGTVWPFILFCTVLPLRTINALLTTVLLALGRADVAFKLVLIWAAIITPAFLFGVQFGVTGVAAAWALGFPLVYFFGARLIAASLSIPSTDLWAPMLAPALSAAGCVAAALAVGELLSGQLVSFAILPLQIIGGALTYGLLLRGLSRSSFHEIFDLLGRLTRRRARPSVEELPSASETAS